MRAQQLHGAERIGALPGERHAVFRRQRFRQDQPAIAEGQRAHRCCHPERRARRELAKHAAEQRAGDEAGAEGSADQPVAAGAILGRRDVGHVGKGRGEARRGDAGDDAAERQPPQVRRDRHQHVVAHHAHGRQKDHRTAAVLIRQRADDRRSDELHAGPQRHEHAVDPAGAGVRAGELLDQRRQHRDDDAQRHDIEQRGDQDEGDGRLRMGGESWHATGLSCEAAL